MLHFAYVIWRNGLRALIAIGVVIGLFLLSAWIGALIPRNADWVEPESGVALRIETNGIHTAIVMPLVNDQRDWRGIFPAEDLEQPNRPYTHISISWGEREVFLNTPHITDIKPATALRAALSGDGLLHVAHYVRPALSNDHRELIITPQQYARLLSAIDRQIVAPETRERFGGYGDYDVFYDAPGTYHLGNTCNQWTGDLLAEAGVKVGYWTPMSGGLMRWIEPEGA